MDPQVGGSLKPLVEVFYGEKFTVRLSYKGETQTWENLSEFAYKLLVDLIKGHYRGAEVKIYRSPAMGSGKARP